MLTESSYRNVGEQSPVDENLLADYVLWSLGGQTDVGFSPLATQPAQAKIQNTAGHYCALLSDMAELHALWWGLPAGSDGYWVPSTPGGSLDARSQEARAALLEIESAPWGHKFFTKEQTSAWLRVLDDPTCLLDVLTQAPQTLIYGECSIWNELVCTPHSPFRIPHFVGPAPYDVACLYSSCRWWFGRLPMTLVEMRSYYLERLNAHLGQKDRLERYTFDVGFDAARAWRFVTLWPAMILEEHTCLLGCSHHLQAAVIQPAFASLRRLTG